MSADAAMFDHVEGRAADETSETVDRIDAHVARERIARALSKLPRRERDPLLLHVLQGMKYDDIARALDVPVGTVRSRISRGRARIAAKIGEGDRS